jgi:hypothetical protein
VPSTIDVPRDLAQADRILSGPVAARRRDIPVPPAGPSMRRRGCVWALAPRGWIGVASLLASLVLLVPGAGAGEPKPLSGSYQLTTATLVDAPADEPRDTHVRFLLTGKAAADLYAALPVKPKRDECRGDGSLTKSQGHFICTRSPNGPHECTFGVDLRNGRTAAGSTC